MGLLGRSSASSPPAACSGDHGVTSLCRGLEVTRPGLLFCLSGPSDACSVTQHGPRGPVVGSEVGHPCATSVSVARPSSGLSLSTCVCLWWVWPLCPLGPVLSLDKGPSSCAPSLSAFGLALVPSKGPKKTGNRKGIAVPILRGSSESQS